MARIITLDCEFTMKAIILKNKLWFLDGASPVTDQFDPTYKAWV